MTDTLHLIEMARAGDSRALGALYGRHRGRLLAFVAARLPADAARYAAPEDIVQETLLESARKLESFEPRGPSSFYRWLVGIARFKIAEAVRARRARKRALEAPLEGDLPADQTSPSGRAIRGERSDRIREALAAIPGTQAEAVRLRYLEGHTLAECAERLSTTPAAVKALVSRGLAALAPKMKK